MLAQTTTTPASPQSDRYIVVLDDDVDSEREAGEDSRRHATRVKHVYSEALKGYSATIPAGQIAALRQDPDVKFINRDLPVKADQVSASTGGATGVDRVDAEPPTGTGTNNSGSGAGVAVIDTGIQLNHPDLQTGTGTGVVDGKDCKNPGTTADDDHGHGTHVAGTIAARDNNGTGVVGVAPAATLYAVKVLDRNGSGFRSDIICGIDWVTANAKNADGTQRIHAANVSIGGSGADDGKTCAQTTDAYKLAFCRSRDAGVTYAVSAGNSNVNLKGQVPAAYREGTAPLVLTVTAVADFNGQPNVGGINGGRAAYTCRKDVDDTRANFSNYTTVGHADANHTIAAPGVCIKSTWIGSAYNTISGTSMAAPHVTGSAALCVASGRCTDTNGNGKIDPAEVMSKLRNDAAAQHRDYGFTEDPHRVTSSGSRYFGYQECARGYRSATSACNGAAPDTTPPTVSSVSPRDGATGVSLSTTVTATFSESMDPATLTNSTVTLKAGTTTVTATVSYDEASKKVTLKPSAKLATSTKYTATVKGGTGGVKDKAGNPLGADKVWSFTTTSSSGWF